MSDLAIIVVSTNEARWLRPCLTTLFEHAGGLDLDVVIADNMSTDGTRELVEKQFPQVRVVTCENRGFAHANNRALMTTSAPFVLFLNPDTEVADGTFADLITEFDVRPRLGLVGVRQVTADGSVFPTIHRFPTPTRLFFEAIGSEHYPFRAPWLGERELAMSRYSEDVECDWTSGSFMLARREALESSGYLDERFFLYSEEVDLCLRVKRAGWEIRHLPTMTIVHHANKSVSLRMAAQDAFSRRQYIEKNYSGVSRAASFVALSLRYAMRAALPGDRERRTLNRVALATLAGRAPPPFGAPPPHAVAPRHLGTSVTEGGPSRSIAAAPCHAEAPARSR